MKTKKVKVILHTYDDVEEIEALCKKTGIIVRTKYYDTDLKIYVFNLEVTKDQAYEVLGLINSRNGLLLKGE